MLTFRSAVIGTVLTGFFGATAAVVGCSAEGAPATDDYLPTQDQQPTDPNAGSSVKLPPKSGGANSTSSSSSGSSSGAAPDEGTGTPTGDAGPSKPTSSDAGVKTDGGVSAAPPPAAGASCSVIDQKYKQICGKCGSQEAICVSTPDGTSGSVSAYGPCNNESTSATACVAGASEDCGNCGKRTCSNTCGWGACSNQGVCRKGTIQHDNAGCPTPGTWRSQTCTDTCGWTSLSASACESPNVVVPAVGDTSSTIWELKASQQGMRPKSCKARLPDSDLTPVTVFPVALKNPTANDAIVSIWNSTAVPLTTTTLDTTIFTYLRDTAPTTNAEYKDCYTESIDNCTSPLPCAADGGSDWAGVDNVKVPANSTIIVMTAGFRSTTTGKFVLNVKTKSN